jgi:hypothetical protein
MVENTFSVKEYFQNLVGNACLGIVTETDTRGGMIPAPCACLSRSQRQWQNRCNPAEYKQRSHVGLADERVDLHSVGFPSVASSEWTN